MEKNENRRRTKTIMQILINYYTTAEKIKRQKIYNVKKKKKRKQKHNMSIRISEQ